MIRERLGEGKRDRERYIKTALETTPLTKYIFFIKHIL